MDTWTFYVWMGGAMFLAGVLSIIIAMYFNWQIFSSYGTGDLWAGLAAAVGIWFAISITWPLSLPGLLIYRLYLIWERRDGSHLARGD